jgi:RNA polymerase sigma-70 factor (ECF subfamily)
VSDADESLSVAKSPIWFPARMAEAQPALYSYACIVLGGAADAWDVLQNANQLMLEKAHEVQEPQGFMPWAYTVVRFQAMAFRKRTSRDRHIFSLGVLEKLSRHADVQCIDFPERVTALEECIRKLPERQREYVDMRYQGNLAVGDIARRLNRPENAVSSVLYRARLALAECIARRLAREGGP